jgi:hypothetical protein
MPPSPGAAPGYRPRPASNQLKEIVEDSMEELVRVWDDRFRDQYGAFPARVQELLARFLECGDLHYGFVRLRCVNSNCHKKDERIVPYSCRARGLCPSCGQRRAIEWAERMVEEVLPLVPFRQLVFTIPVALRKSFLFDRSLFGDLCRVAYASTRDFMRKRAPLLARQGKAVPAMVVSPQSFSDLLVPHAHAHAAVSLGLFRQDGVYFLMEDLDFTGLEEVFRERFFEMMLRRGKMLPETVEKFKSWPHSGFHTGWQERRIDAGDRKNLEGLLTYMERPAVSLRRLRYRDDGMVHYQGTRFNPRLGIDHQLLTSVEFLALLVPHVALKYEVTLRLYGAVSTTFRRKVGWIQNPPVHRPPKELIPLPPDLAVPPHIGSTPTSNLPSSPCPSVEIPPTPGSRESSPQEEDDSTESPFLRKRKRTWAKLISKVWLEDPSICRSCGKKMKIIAVIAREQLCLLPVYVYFPLRLLPSPSRPSS